jgi:hypothetical protein
MTPAAPPFLPDPFRLPLRPGICPTWRPAAMWWLDVPPGTDSKYRIN